MKNIHDDSIQIFEADDRNHRIVFHQDNSEIFILYASDKVK